MLRRVDKQTTLNKEKKKTDINKKKHLLHLQLTFRYIAIVIIIIRYIRIVIKIRL